MPVVTSRDHCLLLPLPGYHVGRSRSLVMDVVSYVYGALIFIGGLIGYFKAGEYIIAYKYV